MTSQIPEETLPPEFRPKEKFPYPTETYYPTLSSFVPTLKEFLNEYKCASPLFPRLYSTVISVNQDVTLLAAFGKLIEYKIMSLPIIDATTNKPIGSFSMMDFINILCSEIDEKELQSINSGNAFSEFLKKKEFTDRPLKAFPSIGQNEPLLIINGSEPLLKAVMLMITKKGHRVLVVNDEGKLINLITQTRVLGLLSTALDSVEEAQKSLQELSLGFRKVLCVPKNTSAFQGFKFLKDNNITGCGVIDESGKLIGNLSINDLKTLGYSMEYFNLLTQPLSKYLQIVKEKEAQLGSKALAEVSILCATAETSLMQAIKMLVGYKVHRLYIVDKEQKPIGLLSLHDVLSRICSPLFPTTA